MSKHDYLRPGVVHATSLQKTSYSLFDMTEEKLTGYGLIFRGRMSENMRKIQAVTVEEVLKSKPWKMVLMVCIHDNLLFTHRMLIHWCAIDKLTAKAQKITIKLPWEITTIYSEALRQSGHQSDDEEDEDDIEAHEASVQRLKVSISSLLYITISHKTLAGS